VKTPSERQVGVSIHAAVANEIKHVAEPIDGDKVTPKYIWLEVILHITTQSIEY
jgi:hypothetical protein